MLARTTVVSVALQALIERSLLARLLNTRDLSGMRQLGLDLAADMRAHRATSAQASADRLEREINAWSLLDAPEPRANDPQPPRGSLDALVYGWCRAPKVVKRGEDPHPGAPPGLVPGCIEFIRAHRRLDLGIGTVLTDQEIGAAIRV